MASPYAHVAGPDYTVMLLLYGFPTPNAANASARWSNSRPAPRR